MLYNYLQDLQENSGISRRDIADRSGVPRSTVDRILSGESDDPKFQNVADIVIAMGGSLDELVGIIQEEPESVQIEDPVKVLVTAIEASKNRSIPAIVRQANVTAYANIGAMCASYLLYVVSWLRLLCSWSFLIRSSWA